jgi:hypothetical protein
MRVCLSELERCTTPGPDGRYVFRGVAAGRHSVILQGSAGTATRVVEVPAQPGPVSGVDLDIR